MYLRSSATRYELVRHAFDRVMGTFRNQVVGAMARSGQSLRLAANIKLEAEEQTAIDLFIKDLSEAERLRDQLALFQIVDTVGQISRSFDLLEGDEAVQRWANTLMFAGKELQRIARRRADTAAWGA